MLSFHRAAAYIIHCGVAFPASQLQPNKMLMRILGLLPTAARQLWYLSFSPLAGKRGRSRFDPCATSSRTWIWTWRETWASSWPSPRSWGRDFTRLCSGSSFTPACRRKKYSWAFDPLGPPYSRCTLWATDVVALFCFYMKARTCLRGEKDAWCLNISSLLELKEKKTLLVDIVHDFSHMTDWYCCYEPLQ